METINNMATAAVKVVWGDADKSTTEEPVSGKTGDVSKGEPYDAGNMEPNTETDKTGSTSTGTDTSTSAPKSASTDAPMSSGFDPTNKIETPDPNIKTTAPEITSLEAKAESSQTPASTRTTDTTKPSSHTGGSDPSSSGFGTAKIEPLVHTIKSSIPDIPAPERKHDSTTVGATGTSTGTSTTSKPSGHTGSSDPSDSGFGTAKIEPLVHTIKTSIPDIPAPERKHGSADTPTTSKLTSEPTINPKPTLPTTSTFGSNPARAKDSSLTGADSTAAQSDVRDPSQPETHPDFAAMKSNVDNTAGVDLGSHAVKAGDEAGGAAHHHHHQQTAHKASSHGSGAGEHHVKTTGLLADGGDFDATKPGAGREADRLMDKKGIHHDATATGAHGHAGHKGSAHDEDGHDGETKKHGLKDKIKDVFHHKSHDKAEKAEKADKTHE